MFLIWPKDSGWSRASLQRVRCLGTKCFPLFSWENKQVEKSAWGSKLVAEGRLKLGSHTIICGRRHFSEARLNKIRTLLPAGSGALGPVPTPCSSFPQCPHLSEPPHHHSGTQAGKPQCFCTSCFPSPPTSNQPSSGVYFTSEVALKSIHPFHLHFQCTLNHLQ